MGVERASDAAGETRSQIVEDLAQGPINLALEAASRGLARIRIQGGAGGARIRGLRVAAADLPSPRASLTRGRYDVLVILFDSLRADEVGRAGDATPTLDALADEGVSFSSARAPASWTRPAVASLLSSVSPTTHGVSLLTDGLPQDVPYLPELLSKSGYYTAVLTHSSQLAPRFGFGRGLDHLERFYTRAKYAEYQALTTPGARADWDFEHGFAPVLAAAAAEDRPWFVYLHEMDPHDPYEPPPPYDTRYTEGADPKAKPTGPAHYMVTGFDATDIARLHGLYRGEVTFMDDFLGALLRRLREAQRGRKMLIVFVSDHGEAFGEGGELGHSQVVAEHQLRVPLILQLDDVLPSGVRVDETVELVDVAPTVLDLLGLDPDATMQGRSLLPPIESALESSDTPATLPRMFFAESLARTEVTARYGRWKYVRRAHDPANEGRGFIELTDVDLARSQVTTALYDLEHDPGETTDVSADQPFMAAALGQLLAWHDHVGTATDAAVPEPIGDEERAHLKTLGYIDE
jgi:choline-sulfatase